MSEFSNTQKEFLENLFLKLNSTIDTKTSEIRSEIGKKVEEIKKEIAESNKNLEAKITVLEEQNQKLKYSVLNLERKVRKNNIAIFGVNEEETDLGKSICKIFHNILGLQINTNDFNDVYRIKSNKKTKTPVIVEFISFQKKQIVLKNVKQLKGSNISIANDQCVEDQNRTKILIKHLKEARSKGLEAYIKGGKLIISNEPYTVEQLEKEEQAEDNTGKEERDSLLLTNNQPATSISTANTIIRSKRQIEDVDVEDQNDKPDKKSKPEENYVKGNRQTTIKTRSNSATTK